MNQNLVNIVKRIIAEQGEAILGDPQRLKSYVKDYAAAENKDERVALGRCIEYGAYTALKNAAPQNRARTKAALAQRVHGNTGADIALCSNALDALEAALFGGLSGQTATGKTPLAGSAKKGPFRAILIAAGIAAGIALAAALALNRAWFTGSGNASGDYPAITDSIIKQHIKEAGGKVDGTLRFSIQWNDTEYNPNDFDAHCVEPDGTEIAFWIPDGHPSGGNLDVDIIVPEEGKAAVENITWPSVQNIQEGDYRVFVHCYSYNGGRSGFSAEIEFDGTIYPFTHESGLRQDEIVQVAVVNYSKTKGFTLVK